MRDTALIAPEALTIPTPDESLCPDIRNRKKAWHLGVISNPLSGSNRHQLPGIRSFLDSHHILHREVCNLSDAKVVLDDFARQGVNLIAVNAGDGTVQAVLTTLFHHRPCSTLPVLALLCGGTTNMTAKDLGFRGSRIQALERLIRWTRHSRGEGTIQRRPVLRVRHPSLPAPQYGMFFGAACIHKGIELFHSRVHGLGLSGEPAHMVIVARFLAALASGDLEGLGAATASVRVDGQALAPHRYMLLLIHSLEQLILGLRPHWGQEDAPLRMTAVSSEPRHFLRVLTSLLCRRRSRLATPANGYFSHNCNEIRLSLASGFAIDGEIFTVDPRLGNLLIDDGGQAAFLRL